MKTAQCITDDLQMNAAISIDRIDAMLAFLSDYIREPDEGSATKLHASGLVEAAEAELSRLKNILDYKK